ncbi:MAG: hypothetical protein JWP85_707 [Rhodoglobus sp.]|nr:hypothetical protein [Rhodoglobus sp.]
MTSCDARQRAPAAGGNAHKEMGGLRAVSADTPGLAHHQPRTHGELTV